MLMSFCNSLTYILRIANSGCSFYYSQLGLMSHSPCVDDKWSKFKNSLWVMNYIVHFGDDWSITVQFLKLNALFFYKNF